VITFSKRVFQIVKMCLLAGSEIDAKQVYRIVDVRK